MIFRALKKHNEISENMPRSDLGNQRSNDSIGKIKQYENRPITAYPTSWLVFCYFKAVQSSNTLQQELISINDWDQTFSVRQFLQMIPGGGSCHLWATIYRNNQEYSQRNTSLELVRQMEHLQLWEP